MNEKKRNALRRTSVVFFWITFLVIAVLFFTNDFGIVDIHKTSIIVAVGVDATDEGVAVTAQLAVPKPSQSGDNIEYTEVQGSGQTIADALNEINAKTGFYPQLQFCKLILLGDSCKGKDIFRVLGCLYRKNYSELTAHVAMCDGKASDTLAMPTVTSDMTTTVIERALSDELKKCANVSSVNLKDIALAHNSRSAACYMPFIEANILGTSEDGDNVGGDKPPSGGGENGGSESQSGGSSNGDGGGGNGGGSSSSEGGGSGGNEGGSESGGGGSPNGSSGSGGEQKPVEFTAKRTAVFNNGIFAGLLDEQQAFALNILKSNIRLANLPCETGEYHYSLGLGMANGEIKVKVVDNIPEVTLAFNAYGQITGIKKPVDLKETNMDDNLSPELIQAANKEVEKRFASLMEFCRQTDCDFLGIKEQIYKKNYRSFDGLQFDSLQKMRINYQIDIRSRN